MPHRRSIESTRPRSPTERLAIVFTLAVILVIIAVEVWQLNKSYQDKFREAAVSTGNLARAVDQHARDAIKQADILLSSMVEQWEWGDSDTLRSERYRQLLKRQMVSMPQLNGMFVFGPDGQWLVASVDVVPPGANNADRDYFIYHSTHEDRGVRIGSVITSRSTGDLVIPVSRRVDNPDGSFGGVALATLRVDYFSHFYDGFELDPQGVILLALLDGTILVRRPFDPAVIGNSLAGGMVFKELLPHARTGTAIFPSKLDDIERIYSYQQLVDFPLVVEAASSTASVRLPWLSEAGRSVAIFSMVLAGMLYFGFALLRQIRATVHSQQELELARDALEKLAMQDGLTGLANRRQFDAAMLVEVGRARHGATSLALLMIDIDHFKRYNDHYGHPAGDKCIRAVADAVAGSVRRAGDVVARYGGEEMVVLLPNTDRAGAFHVAEIIRQAIHAMAIEHVGNEAGIVTVSIGLHALVPQQGDADPGQALIRAADEALYQAKGSGRDRICPPM